jgi:hypothetical protein
MWAIAPIAFVLCIGAALYFLGHPLPPPNDPPYPEE